MISRKQEFFGGLGLIIAFVIVLIFFFLPLYHGMNGLDYLDNLYNSISKASAYYIPKVKKECEPFKGKRVTVTLKMADDKTAEQTALLFRAAGAELLLSGSELKVGGDLGQILQNSLDDADAMYHNEGEKVRSKYGYEGRRVLYNWWLAFHEMDRDLKKQKEFNSAAIISLVVKKAIEPSYNYYQIEPQSIGDKFGTVIFSLVFYVVYTLWYGFAILFMFEGWGLQLGH
ncbi:MAG: hypothetical protein P8175_12925 [Deltaproteobacteria bacterium]|jgi:hypothetical protein